MTNEELIKRFFKRRVRGDEESYGLSIRPCHKDEVGTFALFSKASLFPIAINAPKGYFLITATGGGAIGSSTNWRAHITLTTTIAKRLGLNLIFSPQANKANFHRYMENEINEKLLALALILEDHPLRMVFAFGVKYKLLLRDIFILYEGENILGLQKNQVRLLDTDRTQKLWCWLIKENPHKKERELLRKMYMLSRILAPRKID